MDEARVSHMSFRRVTLGAVRLLSRRAPVADPGALSVLPSGVARGEDALAKLGRRGAAGRLHRESNQTM